MTNRYKDFPNGLRIVRRRVNQDDSIRFIEKLLKRVDSYKNQQSDYYKKYLDDAKRIN